MTHSRAKARRLTIPAAALMALLVPATVLGVAPDWTRHMGSKAEDVAGGIAADGGGITVVGTTNGNVTHRVKGGSDAFIRHYNRRGEVLWTRQFGTDAQDFGQDVAADPAGLFVLGSTDGSFAGGGSIGPNDVFVRRYHLDGTKGWTRQFGTTADDNAGAIDAGGGALFIAGSTTGEMGTPNEPGDPDAFLRRYDVLGNFVWQRQFGTAESDSGSAVAVDGAGVTVGGGTDGDLQGTNAGPFTDAYLRRYDLDGNVLWTRQWGQEGDDTVLSVAADSTGITAVGYTHADAMGNEPSQAFIRRFDRDGDLQWSRIFGSPDSEVAWGVAADADALTVTGYTFGDLHGDNEGTFDVFVRRYSRSGTVQWGRQFGTRQADLGIDVAADGKGFTILGHTTGALGGDPKGNLDVFVRRYTR